MGAIADFIARRLWWGLLWLSRRVWIKNLQLKMLVFVPQNRRDRFKHTLIAQNRFARKHGLRLLTLSIYLVIASGFLTTCYFIVLWIFDSGLIAPIPQPEDTQR